ncbi:MAG: rod shape-determining protein RodA [Chloroflexi bacterium]|nr:rod shape-determining protein RodA [Chloroflexota bacterium]
MQSIVGRRPLVLSRTIWRRFDLVHFFIVLLLVAIGEVMIYSAYETSLPADVPLLERAVFRQSIFALVGFALYLTAAAIDYRALGSLAPWIYGVVVLLLAITLTLGRTAFGAQSWLDTEAPFDVQPSELAKVLMILVLARYLGDDPEALESPKPLLLSILLILPPAVLIYVQPDFGTALILLAIWAGMVFLSGVRWRHLFLLALVGAIAAPAVWFQMEDYMRQRIVLFFFPEGDPSGASYNVMQALISIGSGGWLGKGLLRGTQSQLHFLRVRHTDFIFSVLAEEMGFVGAILLLTLFAVLILRLARIAMTTPDTYGRLLVAGVASMILVQTVINVGMNANLLPVTGLPLPLVSYGGSSLVTTLLALGLTQGVAMRSKPADESLLP